MKTSFQAILFLFFAGFFQNSAQAEDYYIMYNPSCMDRLEYAYGFTPEDQHYVKYHIKLNTSEVIVLEIGLESESPVQNYLSSSTIDCGDERLNRELTKKIRNNTARVFLVRQKGNKYQISRANMASYFRRDNQGVVYDSWQFGFKHSGGLNAGDVLTDDPSKMLKVTYQGTTQYECTDAYLFRMEFTNGSNYRDLFFLTDIGVVEERPNSGNADDTYKLENFNETPFSSYLQQRCRNNSSTLANNFLRGSNSPSGSTQPTGSNAPLYHEVERGETAYAICRKHDISIDELRAWNPGLKNASLVQVGDRLRVSSPTASTQPPANSNSDASDGFAWNGSSKPSGNALNYTPANGNLTAKGQKMSPWDTTDGSHTVQPGETVALLALKYGYTEARFRDINNLGPRDIVKVGQRVTTTACPPASMSNTSNGGFVPETTNSYPSNGSGFFNTPGSRPSNSTNTNNYNASTTTSSQVNSPNTFTLPAYSRQPSNTGMGTGLTPRSPNSTFSGRENTTTAPQQRSSSSFEPYGTNGPDFSTLPPAGNGAYSPANADNFSQGLYPNTDSPFSLPASREQNNSRNMPPSPSSSGNGSSSFGTPIPTNGVNPQNSTNYNARGNSSPATRSSDPFKLSTSPSYYSPDDNRNNASSSYQTTHIVTEGETLESIARKYNTTAERLQRTNNLERTEVLIPYQKLYIN